MVKEKKPGLNTEWYDLWMKQSKEFFDSANKNLQDMFEPGAFAKPEDHLKQINQWLETLKNQWKFTQFSEQQKAYENYWKMMSKMCNDASDMMLDKWMERSREDKPIKNIRELYELWLNCCQEIYKKSMVSKDFQEAYGEFMNAALHFWKSTMPK